MTKMIFMNLPVRDLGASTRFYEAIGCTKNEMFSTAETSLMSWSDSISFMLMSHAHYASFATKPIADARVASGFQIALSQSSRAEVDALTEAAARAGGKADIRAPQDMGFMYQRILEDPDGHVIEPTWMNPEAIAAEVPA